MRAIIQVSMHTDSRHRRHSATFAAIRQTLARHDFVELGASRYERRGADAGVLLGAVAEVVDALRAEDAADLVHLFVYVDDAS